MLESEVPVSAGIGPHVSIGKNVTLGEGVVINAGCVIGDGAAIGDGSVLYCTASDGLSRLPIGQRCIVHAGAVIGADGFGFAPDGQDWVKIPQLGRVLIGNDVEIGANTTIDRGADGHDHRGRLQTR